MPRLIRTVEKLLYLSERVALIELSRNKLECLRAHDIISRTADQNQSPVVLIQSLLSAKWFVLIVTAMDGVR